MILSEAVSCSPVLRGSFAVNPWQVQAVADAMTVAVTAESEDKTAWHEVSMILHTYIRAAMNLTTVQQQPAVVNKLYKFQAVTTRRRGKRYDDAYICTCSRIN